MSDEVGMRIRVDEALRREFIDACKECDTTGAQVLRAFMRAYIERHAIQRQAQLFQSENRDCR